MEYKICLVLATALCLGSVCPQKGSRPPYACQCLMEVHEREGCESSFVGITAEQCTANGCCFDASVPDVPWCFKPSGERVSLNYARKMIPPQERKDCGFQGISRKRCKRIGCCFDLRASGAPTCFYPPVNDASRHCVMDRSARLECGYPGITAEECQAKGCCFSSYVVSTRWCFHPLSDTVSARICGMTPKRRVQCGTPGISADECMEKGCCYEHHQYARTVPWCFKPYEKQGNYSYKNYFQQIFCLDLALLISYGVLKVPDRGKQAAMEQKKFWLLVMVLFLGFSSLANGFSLKPSSEECQVQPSTRMNCGYPYISAQECYNRGCCFDSSIVGVIWCFFPDHSECFI
ncbi:putative gastrointestinal growth factor xP4 [Python bivittatus]|uniref:Trefoil factor 3 n=1 Tax=Python bivittatus TaxID=176946 RepID=A0A9F5IRX3_PYTBI|nr:putative gastrointestinal growth factor xP4 [Python bivittatus]